MELNTMAETSESDESEYSRRNFMGTAAAATGASVTAGLAGCIGGSDSTGENDFLWWTMRGYIQHEVDTLKEMASGFEDWYDGTINVTTNATSWQNVNQEWEAAIQAREMPNVTDGGYTQPVSFGERGVTIPNTELFEEYDDWHDSIATRVNWDGEKWGIPWFNSMRNMFYNMDYLGQAGHNEPPENWEDLVNVARDVEDETDATGFGTPGARDQVGGQNTFGFVQQAGGSYYSYDTDADEWRVNIDDAESLFGHLWYLSLREEWDVAPSGWGGIDSNALNQLYHEERLGMVKQSPNTLRHLVHPTDGVNEGYEDLVEATEVGPMVEGPMGDKKTFSGGGTLSAVTEQATKHASGESVAKEFLEYMILPDTVEDYFNAAAPGKFPTRDGQEEIELFQDNPTEIPDQWIQAQLEQVRNSIPFGMAEAERNSPFLGTITPQTTGHSTAMSAMVGSDEDPKEALVDMANTARQTIEENSDYSLTRTSASDISLSDAPDEVQPWIEGDGVPAIYNPYE